MNTRFDGQLWIGAFGVTLDVKEMETGHLLNTENIMQLYTMDEAFRN